ncbi:GNAT family N-acetyltransferase [Allobranchiibius sp. GilTou38]|uniref:GNAT family N-acetyltransferase n=1 Tax=Allobranchiibius sp. GilTou38 TaxID=2815210 RepID=UPI001AA1809B|nr:GNAT family N-acetyltransferase [Allobranchiibius sp. GilTou38]MBO1766818.1 GNAT family N-acetyltransferase [Allobranchiibius sp. GilTou38]
MVSALTIRESGPNDWRAAGELRWAWDIEDGDAPAYEHDEFVRTFADWIGAQQATHTCWVAQEGEAIVGMAFLVRTPRPPRPSTGDRWVAEIQSVYVPASHRGRGIGSQLVDTLIERARTAGSDRVIVHSRPKSVQVYHRAGFATTPLLMERTP